MLASALAQVTNGDTDTTMLIAGIISIALGILILIVPRILNYIVAAYLIVVGALFLIGAF